MTENQFLDAVLKLTKLYGWRSAHFRPGLTQSGNWRTAVAGDGKGFPDLVLVRGERLIFAELKSETGKLSPPQVEWLDALGMNSDTFTGGHELGAWGVFVWRPSELQAIAETLK